MTPEETVIRAARERYRAQLRADYRRMIPRQKQRGFALLHPAMVPGCDRTDRAAEYLRSIAEIAKDPCSL